MILGAVSFSLMMINFQHSEFEMIYRSFKKHQQNRAIEQTIMSGSLQMYYENGGRSTSYDYHKPPADSSISAEHLEVPDTIPGIRLVCLICE